MPYTIAEDGVRLYYESIGSGEPLLLLSGQASDRRFWRGVLDDLARHRQAIVFDYRGTGNSDKPVQAAWSTRDFARDAIAILDALGIARAHVYGYSMGGRIAQWLGIDHGSRLGALVLGATTPGNAHGVRRPPEADAVFRSGDQARLLEMLVSPQWLAAHPEFADAHAASMSAPPHVLKLHYRASEAHDTWALLPTITAPTLVIHGTEDQVNVAGNGMLLAERIPHAELHLIDGARHGYLAEFREESSRVVNAFLERHPLY